MWVRLPITFLQGILTIFPLQQCGLSNTGLDLFTRSQTLTTLGTGKHAPLDGTWFEAHGALIFTGIVAVAATASILAIK